jgi:hypothetical protein
MKRPAIGVFNGNWKNKWKRDLDDISVRGMFVVEENKLSFGDALAELKAVDPNWEEWFDNDENIPPEIYWKYSDEIEKLCKRMLERAKAVNDANHTKMPELRIN